jgi:hypothetical protein
VLYPRWIGLALEVSMTFEGFHERDQSSVDLGRIDLNETPVRVAGVKLRRNAGRLQ